MTFAAEESTIRASRRLHEDILSLCGEFQKYNFIDEGDYEHYDVKRGLRNFDGTGVVAGLTNICNVHGYVLDEGDKTPIDGELIYRGIRIQDLVQGCESENRFGFEETIWLLLFGKLPTRRQLDDFTELLSAARELPDGFVEDMIIKAPSPNIMNKLARSVLALYSYDENPEDQSLQNTMRICIGLIAKLPSIIVHAYQVKRRFYDHQSMFFHPPMLHHSTAENILYSLRADNQFSPQEARLLDLCLMLHAEHGGGNNSTFATRVLTSSGTDPYSAVAAGVGALKGHRHGGANHKVLQMLGYIKEGVSNWEDDEEIAQFLEKILLKEAGDGSGLIYGIGHAVYTKSDPRAIILRDHAMSLAKGTQLEPEFRLLHAVERLAPGAFAKIKHDDKVMCANVDLYSGLVYQLLGIPSDLFTPLFATARIAGWSAHIMEEMTFGKRIIRPAYKALVHPQPYLPLAER